ncbi:MAG: LysM peptidoglycan-binding domain-containing protein [Lachnospiraceae bacterium]|nr:LysM peptidoglycan-binding domain-containing protein [Lachnospiraceae bacterium]
MAAASNVSIEITYDGTVKETSSGSSASSSSSSSSSSSGLPTSYTVVSGDTLWALARTYYGSGNKYTIIYDANADTIESVAKAHGKSSSDNGHWIFPGTVLNIPIAEVTTVTSAIVSAGTSNPALGSKMAEAATGLTYTDIASGESDSVTITIQDREAERIGSLKPPKGADLGVQIIATNWNGYDGTQTLDCGTFVLDDLSYSGRPRVCSIGGVSVPIMNDFKSLSRSNTWDSTTIKDIASTITDRYGATLYYDADTIQISEIEQNNQTDSSFLYSLCEKYGLSMKVYNNKIVIFDPVTYEAKAAVMTIYESNMEEWSYDTTVDGTYTGVSLDYSDPDTDETYSVLMGTEGRLYSITSQASSQYDAELQAAAKVNEANREIDTMEITIVANPSLVASHCVDISGVGSGADGKYYVDKIKHTINDGYKMVLTLHKVQTPILVTTPVASSSAGTSYTVVSGDTLWALAKTFYGSGKLFTTIYDANAEIIESTAKAHGKASSENGHWIYPGTVLTIPGG